MYYIQGVMDSIIVPDMLLPAAADAKPEMNEESTGTTPKSAGDLAPNQSLTPETSHPPSVVSLPRFWDANPGYSTHLIKYEQNTPEAWRALNAESPSLLRHQGLWYFEVPALMMSSQTSGMAKIIAHTDGFHSIICVSSDLLHNPHRQSVKELYFGQELPALVFKDVEYVEELCVIECCSSNYGVSLAVDLRKAGDTFEKALRLRNKLELPSLLVVRNIPAVKREINQAPGFSVVYVTVRKHKFFSGIVSVASSDAPVYEIYNMKDGLELGHCSGVLLIGLWILDLRTFPALKMLFQSELTSFDETSGEMNYLLEHALQAFDHMHEEDPNSDEGIIEEDQTSSTALPTTDSEGSQGRESPNSAMDYQLDVHEIDGSRAAELKDAVSHIAVESTLIQESDKNGTKNKKSTSSDCSTFEERKCGNNLPEPHEDDETQSDKESKGGGNGGGVSTAIPPAVGSTANSEIPVEKHKFDKILEHQGRSPYMPATAEGSELSSEEQQPCTSPEADGPEKPSSGQDQQDCNSRLDTSVADAESEVPSNAIDTSENQSNGRSKPSQAPDVPEGCTVSGSTNSPEPLLSTEASVRTNEEVENILRRWMVDQEYQIDNNVDDILDSEIPNHIDDTCYPVREFEYWAVEDVLLTVDKNFDTGEKGTLNVRSGQEVFLLCLTTSWAFCRTEDGELGYIPTNCVPDAFRKLSGRSRIYSRYAGYVDRYYKTTKQSAFYPGEVVVILADRGKWILVRDYYRPFRQAYIPCYRVRALLSTDGPTA